MIIPTRTAMHKEQGGVQMENVVRALMLVVALVAATAAGAQIVYKSINPDGTVVYGDHPPANGKIEKVMTFADLPSSPLPPLAVPSRQQPMSHALRAAPAANAPSNQPQLSNLTAVQPVRPRNVNVTLYSATWCGYCKRAKVYLAQRGIPYENIDVETSDGRAAFAQMGNGGVPLLVAGKKRIRGFKPEGYDAFFANR
jgi:glutaredoxin